SEQTDYGSDVWISSVTAAATPFGKTSRSYGVPQCSGCATMSLIVDSIPIEKVSVTTVSITSATVPQARNARANASFNPTTATTGNRNRDAAPANQEPRPRTFPRPE